MAVAGGADGIGVYGELQFAAAMVELLQLQTEAVELCVVLNGKGQYAAPGIHAEADRPGGKGDLAGNIAEFFAVPGRHMGLGGTECEFVHSKPPQKSKK